MTKVSKSNSLLEQVLARTESNIVKKRSSGGKSTYLALFVDVLTDEDGKPTAPKTRTDITALMSFKIVSDKVAQDLAEGKRETEFALTQEGTSEDDMLLATVNKKCKNQVASAIANNNNSTSISFNEDYKNKWRVEKHPGGLISLVDLENDEEVSEEAEA